MTPKATTGSPLKRAKVRRIGDRVGHDAEIVETNRAAGRQADHRAGQIVERPGAGKRADRLIAAADLGPAAGQIDIGAAQPVADVHRRQADRLHAVRIERHQDFAFDAADALDLRHAAHALQARA